MYYVFCNVAKKFLLEKFYVNELGTTIFIKDFSFYCLTYAFEKERSFSVISINYFFKSINYIIIFIAQLNAQ